MSVRRLGRYELLEQLGEGGMGSVWLARLTGGHGFEKLCIVKTVLPSIAKDPEFVSRFLHEGRVLTQLHHANIAQVYDMGEEEGALFLALEYVPGVDLSTLHQQVRARDEQLPLSLAIYVAQQMAEGLGYAHRRAALDGTALHIVHRDVSPQNVMVSYDGEVKVIDFGIARSEARSRHTAQASVMGKLGYMAPEQAKGEALDHRADQFAVGVVLWELLANAPYVPRGTLTEMVVAMASPPVRLLTPLRPDVPPSLEATVLKALSADVSRRFPTTDDLARALMDELLRLGALPSKLQVGEYVQSRCTLAFSSQQKLLTRISTLRAQPTVASTPETARATPQTGLESTMVRTSGEHPLPATEASRPTGPPSEVLTVPGRGQPSTAQVTAAPAPTTAPMPAAQPPVLTTAELQAASVKRGRGPLLAVAGVGLVLLVAAGAWAFLKGPLARLSDTSGGTVTAGAGAAGTDTQRTGTPGTDTQRTGTPGTGTAGTGTAGTDTPGTDTPGAGTPGTGTPGTDTPGTDTPGTDTPPATADAADSGSAGPTMAGTGEAPPPPGQGGIDAPPPPGLSDAEPPPKGLEGEPAAQLKLSARSTGQSYIVSNTSRQKWTGCTVVAPGQRAAHLGALGGGISVELPMKDFRVDPRQRQLTRALFVSCAQGTGRVGLK
ncbi:MAG: protein kinase [Myxococcales bacterium]|nr:protein kinase [Myxococcales bacterium]